MTRYMMPILAVYNGNITGQWGYFYYDDDDMKEIKAAAYEYGEGSAKANKCKYEYILVGRAAKEYLFDIDWSNTSALDRWRIKRAFKDYKKQRARYTVKEMLDIAKEQYIRC